MKRLLTIGCCILFVLATVTPSLPCGDKVLALGRAMKLTYVSTHSASILLYLRSGSPSGPALSDGSLQSALKKSSQVLRIASDAAELEQALNRGKYDLIITDLQDAPIIEQQLQAISSHTVIVPLLYQATKVEASALAKRYHVVVKVPSKTDNYLLAINEAMEMKAKRDEIKVVAKK